MVFDIYESELSISRRRYQIPTPHPSNTSTMNDTEDSTGRTQSRKPIHSNRSPVPSPFEQSKYLSLSRTSNLAYSFAIAFRNANPTVSTTATTTTTYPAPSTLPFYAITDPIRIPLMENPAQLFLLRSPAFDPREFVSKFITDDTHTLKSMSGKAITSNGVLSARISGKGVG